MERHHHGVVDLKLLHQGEIEAGVDGLRAQMRAKRAMRGHVVTRQLGHIIIRSRKLILDADRKNGKVVQEECIAMIGIEDHDEIWTQRSELLPRSGV